MSNIASFWDFSENYRLQMSKNPENSIALALDLVDYTYPIYVALFRAHYTPIILGLRYARESKQSEQENKQRKHLEGHRYDHQVDHEREKMSDCDNRAQLAFYPVAWVIFLAVYSDQSKAPTTRT